MEVIYVVFSNPSYNWANGLYIIIEENDNEYHLCRLLENGLPELSYDGTYSISCTGKGNKGITKTNLRYYENLKKQVRKEKIEKINSK